MERRLVFVVIKSNVFYESIVFKNLPPAAISDCPDEGSCFAALCLRNGVRLAGMSRYRKAAVWLTAATRNAHFLDKDNQALAYRRLAQVYFEWGAIDDVSNDVTYSRETYICIFPRQLLTDSFRHRSNPSNKFLLSTRFN